MNRPPDDPTLTAETKRGRPRLAEAMTPAQRAKRYRDKKKRERAGAVVKKDASNKRDVTQNAGPSIGLLESRIILLNAENIRLSQDLEVARDRLDALSAALAVCLRAHAAKKALTDETVRPFLPLLSLHHVKVLGIKNVTGHKK
jgi:hypothetical protein